LPARAGQQSPDAAGQLSHPVAEWFRLGLRVVVPYL